MCSDEALPIERLARNDKKRVEQHIWPHALPHVDELALLVNHARSQRVDNKREREQEGYEQSSKEIEIGIEGGRAT